MQDFESYIFREQRPKKSDEKYSIIYYYKNGTRLAQRKHGELIVDYADFYKHTIDSMITERIFDDAAYQYDLINYNKRKRALEEKFKTDLFEELGISNHPKRNKLYEICNDTAYNYESLYNRFDELVDLIKD